uniref:Uncharacterized protein n=1 Tax=Anguilla anguilla TaxID=7936 RepID=A0A0E9TVZ2_ANGAN
MRKEEKELRERLEVELTRTEEKKSII